MAILLAGLTSIFYGVFDFADGVATRRAPVFAVAFWSNIMALALSEVVALVYHVAFGSAASLPDLAWGAASGVAGVAGVVAYYEGLAKGKMAVVAPVSAITLSLIPFTFGLLTGERYALLPWIGVAIAAPAMWLTVATGTREDRPGKAIYGLGAGLGFSLMFIGLAQVSGEAGMWPLIAFRCAAVATSAVLVKAQGIPLRMARKELLLSFAAGGAILANLSYLLAVRIGPLSGCGGGHGFPRLQGEARSPAHSGSPVVPWSRISDRPELIGLRGESGESRRIGARLSGWGGDELGQHETGPARGIGLMQGRLR